jgi:hypothetical protein
MPSNFPKWAIPAVVLGAIVIYFADPRRERVPWG